MKQRKKPEDRKKEIINVAFQLFLEYGYETITMNKIANESGIAKGLCYHYFPSKEELYEEVLSDFVDQLVGKYLVIIKNDQLTLEDKLNEMSTILRSYKGKSLFYDFSRKNGNKRVYIDILYRTFNRLIPELTNEFIRYSNLSSESFEKIETLMSFILFGQLGILTEKGLDFEHQLMQLKAYIQTLLEYEKDGGNT
ncbi:TetR/AcrR family transcriptional regulator [Vagococcus entomophilus]|uniref:HTH tetR-type domain-containing protein n=1 Tax=Vagococcus entomophilus TaxID=1160095 RepID=A0A430AJ93_9ENTE|nr:TetR/AcrR family transcriptional regulator [Vagococcus entomophilus]RSU08186.1 hypothetical protein CBF30_02780 [Vagococcus entomophilus]